MRTANKGSFKVGQVNQWKDRTHCIRGHEYTPENTRIRVRDYGEQRVCRECKNLVAKLALRILRKQVISVLGGKCACCGETDIVFLAADHIEGKGNQHRREVNSQRISKQIVGDPEVRKLFQCLCFNCNQAKHILGYCPHELRQLRFVGKVA
jgi:hypothetical protein